MAVMYQSIATISGPEFINLQPLDINPLMSKCEIKVLYIGENRNSSYITKEVATEMAKTLRGAPIVGYWSEDKKDFRDHGEQIIFDGDGIKFNTLTKPYGFVSPDAEVWFQTFTDTDEFGNQIEHEYLMTTGYLWTGQYEEAKSVFEGNGKNQSMELDPNTVDGHWAENRKNGMEFFIINDAIFSKLCILGDDVEPCFEGASVTAPQVSSVFTRVDGEFTKTLYGMMKELQFALKGGDTVENETIETVDQVTPEENTLENAEFSEESQDNIDENVNLENQEDVEENDSDVSSDFEKKDEEESEEEEEEAEEGEENTDEDKEEEDDEKKKYSLLLDQYTELENKYNALTADFSALQNTNKELVTFKNQIEDQQKDALINQFYMLSDEDKKDVIENKANYSLDEIKAKLSVICFDKKVSFMLEDTDDSDNKDKKDETMTFNLDNNLETGLPDWVKAVKDTQKSQI